ncbi:protein-disulfide reductase DsbD [Motiliproteus sp. MSK22-1]|uniref:protein-disulfide reductase DsbD n=1 Tax=Motiliproteus sp. MSK22-1 TaxID=1897630 RepID=UPI000975AE39|nr:protein-disulfide reductase DsbD [Motiliproteus sp. MSK22-1]OMH31763.1 hypothetical protein BGP75_16745 [Motiliproteus sp. MSK22-1]
MRHDKQLTITILQRPVAKCLPLLLLIIAFVAAPVQAGWWDNLVSSFGNSNLQSTSVGGVTPLTVDEAYQFSYSQPKPGLLKLIWQMPEDGYYLYRDKIKIHTGDTIEVVDILKAEAVEKEDAIYGRSWVYFNGAEVLVALQSLNGENTDVTFKVEYQGCWEGGICYPPEKKTVTLSGIPGKAPLLQNSLSTSELSAPQSNSFWSNNAGFDLSLTDQSRFADALKSSSLLVTLGLFFLAGLALSLTPCIFPMIPILSSVIVGHQAGAAATSSANQGTNTRRSFFYSCVYVLFMALTYTIAGVIAGLFGANIQAAFQNVWIISLFSLMFILFALSMFGIFQFQVPVALQNKLANLSRRQRGGRFTGVASMGVLSALIVGPCVAAPLAGALIYIGQTGDPYLGGAALFSLSIGMGIPLILIGTSAGKILPKAGHWMEQIKAAFGVMMLLMAIWMLDRILPPAVIMGLLGALLTFTAIFMKALDSLPIGSSIAARLGKGTGLLLLVYGLSLLIGLAAGGSSLIRPLAVLSTGFSNSNSNSITSGTRQRTPQAPFAKVTSLEQLQPRLDAAKLAGQPVMLDFYADWCITCKELEAFVFVDDQVQQQFSRFSLIKVDVTANDDAAKTLYDYYNIIGPPALIFYDNTGQIRANQTLIGVPEVADFVSHLKKI